jgi:lipoprotein-anchoring transpeptidase ErfK/SrfK
MRALLCSLPLVLAVTACNSGSSAGGGQAAATPAAEGATPIAANGAAAQDTMLSNDPARGATHQPQIADPQPRPIMQLQVVLDRLGFTPGVVDGKMGLSTRNAIKGFQEAKHLKITGQFDPQTQQALSSWNNIPATRVVTIPASFAAGPFNPIPASPAAQAKLDRLGYTSLGEKLSERFHTTIATLNALNPGGAPAGMKPASAGPSGAASAQATSPPAPAPSASNAASGGSTQSFFRAGQMIRVPNVGADKVDAGKVSDQKWLQTLRTLGVGTDQPKVTKVVVSKSEGTLKGYDAGGNLVAMYTATMGSQHDPLPLGAWKITGISHNPRFSFDPTLLWDVPDSEAKQSLPPGPNGPVGVVWIALSKPHDGIHGTPDPETIGRAQSHGCIRLTNWDAARLAQMVSPGTEAIFKA